MASSDCPASETVVTESSSSVDVKLLLSQGEQSLKAGDVSAAIEGLKEACSVLEKQYGEGAAEVADAYLLYGKALLLKSSGGSSVVPETKDATAPAAPGGDALGAGDTATEVTKESSVGTSTVVTGAMASGDSDSAQSLQVAEKVLGFARDTFSTSEELDAKVKHCDTLLGLGKSYLQRKYYDQSVAYLKKSLDVHTTLSLGNTKALVETYYFLGVCHSAVKRLDESLTDLNLGIAVASSILSAAASVNGAGETEKNEELAVVKSLLQNITSMVETIRSESGIADNADISAGQAAAEPEAALVQVEAAEFLPPATDPGDSANMEVAEGQATEEVAVPSGQNLEPAVSGCYAKPIDGVAVSDVAVDGVAVSDVPSNSVSVSDVPIDGVASDVPVGEVAVSDRPVDCVSATEGPAGDGASASDVPVNNEVALDVSAAGVAVADVPIDGVAASDSSTVALNITNVVWNKRPLEEESQDTVKKAKHDVDGSENGENNVDGTAAVDNADGCHEDA